MQSRRDQVQAHMFVMGRLSLGMLRDDPDAPESAHRRTSRGVIIGLVIGVLIALIVAVYGFVVPGGADAWKTNGTLVVEEKTGARYLSLKGVLHPVLNETSAKLLAGDRMASESVAAASIEDAPRGSTLGIVGAPDALPGTGALSRDAWSACATRSDGAGGPASGGGGSPGAALTLAVGLPAEGRPITADRATLIRGGARQGSYLLWRGTRLRLDTANSSVQALGFGAATAFPVSGGFLNALPAGPDIATPDVPDRGAKGPALAGRPTRIGQLFDAAGGRRFLLRKEGLTPLTALESALLKGDPRTQRTAYAGGAVSVLRVGPDDVARHQAPKRARLVGAGGGAVPSAPPKAMPVAASEGVCAVTGTAGGAPSVSVVLPRAAAVGGRPLSAEPGLSAGSGVADRVAVRPGGGALVKALSSSGAGGVYYLVTESGAKYRVAGEEGLKQLGYSAEQAVRLPSALLGMLATGPDLDGATLRTQGLVLNGKSVSSLESKGS
ncbi:type VII secretion protein EccB [Streptomyces sp. H27-D2]|uniref:type VII secretion protein EccB n=1 Tax=Streptomyces sp. H27-D2 TaxID=3046304 RepID=UPI002DB8A205|nr:type VII secretion protein EccB [Streptomyces sp. H27-D2]MEC4020223.1 type VII secretion protein EccB [Streptomyces sp. H27-D2]